MKTGIDDLGSGELGRSVEWMQSTSRGIGRRTVAHWLNRATNTFRIAALGLADRSVPYASPERLRDIQERRLRATIRHAYRTVPFWRQAMRERGLRPEDIRSVEDLERLPLIDGQAVAADPSAFMSTKHREADCLALHSSGSQSAVRRTVYWDGRSTLDGMAYTERDRRVLRSYLGDAREAWMSPRVSMLRENATAIEVVDYRRDHVLLPKRVLPTHMIPPNQPIEEIVARMNQIRPAVVFSYGSHTEYFFRYVRDRKLDVALPRVWVYGSDLLADDARRDIEREFGCPLHSTYQSVEGGRIGFLCEKRDGFHLNIDLCPVRIVDDSGETVAPGSIGEVVVSNLQNRAMVLLNYRLGDLGAISDQPCSCGRNLPVLKSLVGRRGAVLQMQDGRAVSDLVLSERCSVPLQDVLFWQVEQESLDTIRWRVVPRVDADLDALKQGLTLRTRELARSELDVTVDILDALPVTRSGKVQRLVVPKTRHP